MFPNWSVNIQFWQQDMSLIGLSWAALLTLFLSLSSFNTGGRNYWSQNPSDLPTHFILEGQGAVEMRKS